MRIKINNNDRGFTLLEVILVLIFISIFATIAVSRQANPDVSLTAAAEVLKAHIRYAQMRAMNSNVPWGIEAQSGTSYSLFNLTEGTQTLQILPGESENSVDLDAEGIAIEPGEFTIQFDPWGVPGFFLSDNNLFTPFNGPTTLTLRKGSESTIIITIIENTGFVR